jgi:sugar fermentation stimulation protein A
MGSSLVGVNTQNTNRIWAEALQNRSISEFGRYDTFQPEVKLDPDTRLDFLLTGSDVPPMYVEVKNCTLVQDKAAAFPDAVTARGQKHIKALRAVHDSGMQAALVFVVQRTDARFFQPAYWIDPEYARLLAQAARQGVMVKAYDVVMDTSRITINRDLPVLWE